MKHVFFVPYDAQLLINDFLTVQQYQTAVTQTQLIITALKVSPKQYALLKDHQFKVYDKTVALVSSAITR